MVTLMTGSTSSGASNPNTLKLLLTSASDEEHPKDPANPKPIIMQFATNGKGKKAHEDGAGESDLMGVAKAAFPNAHPRITTRIAALYDTTAGVGKRHTVFFQREAAKTGIYYQFANSEARKLAEARAVSAWIDFEMQQSKLNTPEMLMTARQLLF